MRDKARTMTESPQHPVDLDLRMVRYFTVVAEHRHFGRAAAALRVAQSSLSRQVRRLKQELGARLFDRTPQGTELTEAGDVFLPRARALLRSAAQAAALRTRRYIHSHRDRPYHRDHRHPARAQVVARTDQEQQPPHFSSCKSLKVSWRLSQIMTPCSQGAACFPVHLCPSTTRSPLTLFRFASSLSFWFIGTSWSSAL
jgi:hypothetical protein